MSDAARELILDAGERDEGIQSLAGALAARGRSVTLTGARGGSRAVALAVALRSSGRAALVVTRDIERAQSLAQDLGFLLGDEAVGLFPDIDIAPYTPGIAGMGVREARLETLARLVAGDLRWVVVPVEALMFRVPSPAHFSAHLLTLTVGEERPPGDVMIGLDDLGYHNVAMVEDHGDASRRGGIIDFYTFGRENPVRVEFDADTIESIREFDVGTQRSVATLESVSALPTRELRMTVSELEAARDHLASLHPNGEEGADVLIDELMNRRHVEGGVWLAGLFPDHLADLLDYFPDDVAVVLDGPKQVLDFVDEVEQDTRTSYREDVDRGRFFPVPEANFLFREALSTRIAARDQLILPGATDDKTRAVGKSEVDVVELDTLGSEGFGRNMNVLRESLARHREAGRQVVVLCESDTHKRRLVDILENETVTFEVGSLGEGFSLVGPALTLIADHEIWGRPRRRRDRRRRFKRGILPSELQALKPGDYVVHVEHGIGVYKSMERLSLDGHATDCLLLEYAKGDKLYVPVEQLDLIQRYSASEGSRPSISTIGGTGWAKLKSRVKKRIKIMADELIQVYAKRRAQPGHAYPPDTVWQRELESAFPYDETPDQLTAIEDVKRDMEAARPMDRLVCGDVGFGKTEVAIRAAFKAVNDGRQVAILVPTTLLAEQHLKTFRERMKGYPVSIEMMSRFRTAAEQKKTARELWEGKVDILIGTHRLLSKDINFKRLGLVVIDEEQRFGVRHKEILKKLKTSVDVLTLTATPIPRTLHFSLMGARDMSTIATPPRDRQPIHTEIVTFSDDVIADALHREVDLGGQSFFVHNRVQTIHTMAAYLEGLVPSLRIGVAHGQMPERQIERVMLDFYAREYDVLLSTMIIESGLDIPSVNTILINRADAFGLAQLYQLRGRVGRSSRKAYAFLLVPRDVAITETAQKRLRVIDEMESLGSGFQLAMRDLEIRGAGNILGAEQSGFIVNVGFDMYCRLLDEAVRELKGMPGEEAETMKLSTDLDAFLSDEYIPDRTEKVRIYKRLADTTDLEVIGEIQAELADRFGPIPPEGARLLDLRRLRVVAREMGVTSLIVRSGLLEVLFGRQMTQREVKRLLAATTAPVEFSTTGDRGFRITRFKEASAAEALRLLRVVGESSDAEAAAPTVH